MLFAESLVPRAHALLCARAWRVSIGWVLLR
jgi:hypothetical protein